MSGGGAVSIDNIRFQYNSLASEGAGGVAMAVAGAAINVADRLAAENAELRKRVPPDGWVAVPPQPTREMITAAMQAPCVGHPETGNPTMDSIYRAMLAAAPKGDTNVE